MIDTESFIHQSEEYFAAKNAFTTGPFELSQKIENGENIVVVDVREEKDFRKGHVPGAANLPEDQWQTLRGLSKDVPNIIYCYTQNCHLAARAAQRFEHEGYTRKKEKK
jgi:rhodanese-related sulfurtransferase